MRFRVGTRGDTWAVGIGASNIFDEEPPEVDDTEGPTSLKNVPLGAGYDLRGRTWFLSASMRLFGGA